MGCESLEREKASHKFQEFIALVQPLTDSQGYEVRFQDFFNLEKNLKSHFVSEKFGCDVTTPLINLLVLTDKKYALIIAINQISVTMSNLS